MGAHLTCLTPGFNRAKRPGGGKLSEENGKVHIATGRGGIRALLPDGVLSNSHRVFFASALTEIAFRALRENEPSMPKGFLCHPLFASIVTHSPSPSISLRQSFVVRSLCCEARFKATEAPGNSAFRTMPDADTNETPERGQHV